MAVAMRSNGLHHAVSLGTIEVASKPACNSHFDRSYDSEDENMSRRRLRHTSSTELYPRPSVYSKGDIREQYCLTDRQLNSIERPRRERFFGCLSRRGAPQSFLGVCVGRRVPSDENLAAYAPFPRGQRQYQPGDDKATDPEWDSSYFRRQPASILSTAKMTDNTATNRHSWMAGQTANASENANFSNDQSSYHCPTHVGVPVVQLQMAGTTPRTKHVSFARSHTLTSFDDVNLGLRSSGRLKTARSQERLIGGKKPIIASGSIYETTTAPLPSAANIAPQPQPTFIAGLPPLAMHQHQAVIHPHPHLHPHGHGHSHQHHHGPPIHIHQFVPSYNVEHAAQVQTEQPMPLLSNRTLMEDLAVGGGPGIVGVGVPNVGAIGVLTCPVQPRGPPSPEVVVVEKKFRNAMKTQATQTELRKDGHTQVLALSPRTLHKVKVVSQGAQTNGLQNGKKLTKSLSEMPNGNFLLNVECKPAREPIDHSAVHRTQSEEPPKSPLDDPTQINYYEPPPPLTATALTTRRGSQFSSQDLRPYYPRYPDDTLEQSIDTDKHKAFNLYVNDAFNYEDFDSLGSFDYESNSLPRRTCSFHRETEFNSNSLPRREPLHSHDICKHITECTELMGDTNGPLDFSKPHLLPPPSEYCKDTEDEAPTRPLPPPPVSESLPVEKLPKECADSSRRMSMVATLPPLDIDTDTPFRRDDLRRQSMPIYVKTEKLIDGFGPRSSFRSKVKHKTVYADPEASDEKEIFIDFKPHVFAKLPVHASQQKYRPRYATVSDERPAQEVSGPAECESCRALETAEQLSSESVEESEVEAIDDMAEDEAAGLSAEEDGDAESGQHLYENIPTHIVPYTIADKRDALRKRSVSLDEPGEAEDKLIGISTPPSPCREELLANASTYPSSDSLANDITRDHSDGIWNESQVTVLTAEQKDPSDGSYSSNLLLTPTSKRKNLLLQHQQRSSIDTDALDLEEQFADYSPTYGVAPISKSFKTSTLMPQAQTPREYKPNLLSVSAKMVTPTIAVTGSLGTSKEISPKKSPSRRAPETAALMSEGRRKSADPVGVSETGKFNVNQNTDVSECSTNTDEYATCTDTSKRTPGIKTPPTTTSSSSTTQVPVSTQSSQIDKTHGGSSFESASSLYSTRGDILSEDTLQQDEKLFKTLKTEKDVKLKSPVGGKELVKHSPSHSISSTSSGSYNVAALSATSPSKDAEKKSIVEDKAAAEASLPKASTEVPSTREKPKIKPESISDDERSEMRYSSSGYYESPHDDEHISKFRRHRADEDRKRRKTSMKLDIEKENMRALTSPIKKLPAGTSNAASVSKEKTPEKQTTTHVIDTASPNRIKRFRPKIRRQFRRSSRDDSTPKRQKNLISLYGLPPTGGSSEKLLDCTISSKAQAPEERTELQLPEVTKPKPITSPPTTTTKSASEVCQLKAKSIESLRSVSPGSDSVFYSEADGPPVDQHGHCHHCGKEMEGGGSAISVLGGDSVESLPFIENEQEQEQDIVKPPSDFADSPVTTKTTQRLYKKMDKRFRSEERYHGERGRHYKSRQENIRAKSEERSRESVHTRSPQTLRPAGSSPCVLPDSASFEQSQQIIYRGHYDAGRYTRLTDADLWSQLDHQSFDRQRDRRSSTESEHSFHSKYQVILHRLVQRRCTLEMYHRQRNNSFQLMTSNSAPESLRRKLEEILKLMLLVWARESHVLSTITAGQKGVDKTIVVKSDSGEFGFRIHGSKPVVVAAIEPDTPAESSGLEVGDIIIAVNGVQVLDKHHTEVVKIAHDGCETLELQVARTIGVLMHEQQEPPCQPLYSGYLWRQSGQAKGAPNTKKWVRRWFSLRPDNCLYYYKTENDTQPVGAMIMAKHTIEHCPPEVGKPYAFKIDSGEGIPMYVAADSDELANRWMKVLQQSAAQGTPWLDNCARNLYQSPANIARPDCYGYLLKLGSRWCGWSKRYCVLKDACLYFYQDVNSKNAFGMACLHGYKVSSMSTSASGKKNSFEIIPPEAKLRHYYFCTETEMDKKRWISALEYSIDRWIKSG